MDGLLAGKVAVVTGGTSGIGLATAERFIAEGARVFIAGRRQEALDSAAKELGPQAVPVQCDVGNLADLDYLYEIVAEQAGHIDVLVANAAVAWPAALGDITEEQFDSTFAINVKGVVFGVQKAIPLLSPGASVILLGSSNILRPDPGLEVYGATKAAIRHFVRSWTRNTSKHNFRVNVLSPGPTKTPGLLGTVPEEMQDATLEQFANAIPVGRMGRPSEIANAVMFLASDTASYVNGVDLYIDGGYAQI